MTRSFANGFEVASIDTYRVTEIVLQKCIMIIIISRHYCSGAIEANVDDFPKISSGGTVVIVVNMEVVNLELFDIKIDPGFGK